VRLHVRPPVLADKIKHLGDYATTKAIISFPAKKAIPKALVQKLAKASITVMKQKQRPALSIKLPPLSRHSGRSPRSTVGRDPSTGARFAPGGSRPIPGVDIAYKLTAKRPVAANVKLP
jgi:hypothetical protein